MDCGKLVVVCLVSVVFLGMFVVLITYPIEEWIQKIRETVKQPHELGPKPHTVGCEDSAYDFAFVGIDLHSVKYQIT
jgi:hypothetical protein